MKTQPTTSPLFMDPDHNSSSSKASQLYCLACIIPQYYNVAHVSSGRPTNCSAFVSRSTVLS